MYDLFDTACKRNGFSIYGLVPSTEQSLCWQIEYKILLYYLLCIICVKLHVKEMSFIKYGLVPIAEQSLSWQIEYMDFLHYLLCMICLTLHAKEMVSVYMASFLVRNNLCAGKLSIRSFFIIYYV